jgi:hypothetical protein
MGWVRSVLPFTPAAAVAVFQTGLQLSGYTNLPLAVALWVLAGVLLILGAWHYAAEWRSHKKSTSVQPPRRRLQMLFGLFIVLVSAAGFVVGMTLIARGENVRGATNGASTIPLNESSLSEYMRRSSLVRRVDQEIAQLLGQSVDYQNTVAFVCEEEANLLGIDNLTYLESLLDENDESAIRLSHHSVPTRVVAGHCIIYLCQFLASRLGEQSFREYWRLLRTTSGDGMNVFQACEQIATYPLTEKPKPLTGAFRVDDFNLVPIRQAASLVQESVQSLLLGQRMSLNASSQNDLTISYCHWLQNQRGVRFYGSRVETNGERRRLVRRPLQTGGRFSWREGSIVLETRPDMPRSPEYEAIFLLRPDLMAAIARAQSTGS